MDRIKEVKEKADIIEIANYLGLRATQCCPFHKEKSASFYISRGNGERLNLFFKKVKLMGRTIHCWN